MTISAKRYLYEALNSHVSLHEMKQFSDNSTLSDSCITVRQTLFELTCSSFTSQSNTMHTLALKYLSVLMRKPVSVTSVRPLRSTGHLDLFVPRARTALTQRRA